MRHRENDYPSSWSSLMTTRSVPSGERRPCMASGMGTLISLRVFRCQVVESRSQIIVQTDSLAAASVALKLSSPKLSNNALAAEIALVLDELEAELIPTQHIQVVLFYETDTVGGLSQETLIPASLVRVSWWLQSVEAFYSVLTQTYICARRNPGCSASVFPLVWCFVFLKLWASRVMHLRQRHCCVFASFTG